MEPVVPNTAGQADVEEDLPSTCGCRGTVERICCAVFFGVAYVPFCMSIVLHSLAMRRPVDPVDWRLTDMRAFWYTALGIHVSAVTYAVAVPLILSRGALGIWIWPLMGSTFVFHLLTVGYVLQRPELCTLGQQSSFRLRCWRNWLAVGSVIIEFLQLCMYPFMVLQCDDQPGKYPLQRLLFIFADDRVLFGFCVVAVSMFSLLVGEMIYSRHHPSSAIGTLLYEGLAGMMYLTILAPLLRLATVAHNPICQVVVLLGLLLFSTPAIFVSVYRADQRKFSSDVNYSPLLLVRERVAKELWAIFVVCAPVRTTAFSEEVAKLVAVLVLGAFLLVNLSGSSQSSCLAVVRVRRALLILAMWSAAAALTMLALNGACDVGWHLLLVGGVVAMSSIAFGVVAASVCTTSRDEGASVRVLGVSDGLGEAPRCDIADDEPRPPCLLVPPFGATGRNRAGERDRSSHPRP